MFRKTKPQSSNKTTDNEVIEPEEKPHKHPMICLFDFETDVEEELKELKFNYETATFGAVIEVNNNKQYDEKLMKPNHDYPNNLHEFDIVMLDMTNRKSVTFNPSQHILKKTSGNKAHALLSSYPEQIFDPRQLSVNIISSQINELAEKNQFSYLFAAVK